MDASEPRPTPLRPADWPEHLPASFYTGLEEINTRQYYQCHETLEALWLADKGSVRQLYQGVLQIAVGCFHLLERQNWRGAVNKLDAGARRLEATGVQDIREDGHRIYGVEWLDFLEASDRLQAHLRDLGESRVGDADLTLLPLVHYTIR
ncbi:hypothetical protein CCAX7_52230 [Capsulimonas corticalis]|uniref:Uncharacterized protein n=1 Tax=Capsulimonas corticalis TaxID=2219043 RepID=A0A402CNW2_9BACT|nr:DUF309 domain-containing protein [Capsulimonas corticalis]BDI33172.1 hypothetical protein CCAX7_52230 [Capsulimonas corticalis]